MKINCVSHNIAPFTYLKAQNLFNKKFNGIVIINTNSGAIILEILQNSTKMNNTAVPNTKEKPYET